MRAGGPAALALAFALAACADGGTRDGASAPAPAADAGAAAPGEAGGGGAPSPGAAEILPEPGSGAAPARPGSGAPQTAPEDVPEIYMALQNDSAGIVSVIFAIDASRDNTPSDDPAIRITPEASDAQSGNCNPQQLRRFDFPAVFAARPVFSSVHAEAEVSADRLPEFMAVNVSREMVRLGYAGRIEDTRAQNICTRKLWELLVRGGTERLAGQ